MEQGEKFWTKLWNAARLRLMHGFGCKNGRYIYLKNSKLSPEDVVLLRGVFDIGKK
jgi:valyl-tRNA synthetase